MDDNVVIVLNQEKTILNERFAFTAINSKSARTNIDNNNEDIINTKRLFGGRSFCIVLSPDTNRLEGYLPNPYFKLGTGDTLYSSKGLSRICFRHPQIVRHTDQPEVKITKRLLDELNRVIRYKCYYKGGIYTVLNIMNMVLDEFARGDNLKYEWVTEYVDFSTLINYKNSNNAVNMF